MNRAAFHLSGEKGAAKSEVKKMMIDVYRSELEQELETAIRRMKKMLNDHYATNNSCLFNGGENATQTRDEPESSGAKH